jgi:membrane-bound serine protease (ClpP class)
MARWSARTVWQYALVLACGFAWLPLRAQEPPPTIHVIAIRGTIDLGLAPFLSRVIHEAHTSGAAAVLLDIDTFGGRVDAAVAMRDALLNSPVRTIAFVNQRAISAGALIALACHTLVMAPGGTIGAAAPVLGGAGASQPADEKSVSYVRKEFRATAETRGRPPAIAEAMVDADVEISGVIEKGKLLTLTSAEALTHKVTDFVAADLNAALRVAGLENATTRQATPTWAETLVRFLTNPIVASLLMTIGMLGLVVELRTPGFAVPGTIGVTALALFFWGHWLVQLAGWEELLLVVGGLVLIALELFVLPGVTVAGIAGGLALVAGLAMTLFGAGATLSVVIAALGRVALALLIAIAAAFAVLRFLPRLPFGRQLVLETGMRSTNGYVSPPSSDARALGRVGTALSPLRPAGIAEIDGQRLDVVSDGPFIEGGTTIEVTRVDGNRIVVRRALSAQEGEP